MQVSRTHVGNGVTLEMATTTSGHHPVVLVHGFPHTRHLWQPLTDLLPEHWRALAPDLRGFGGSSRAPDGYDARRISLDLLRLLDAHGLGSVDLVAIDAGVAPSVLLALEHAPRVRRLVVMEASLGSLPGAESVAPTVRPWWFGFHQVPGLAEVVLEGHEPEYLDFFWRSGTSSGVGIAPDVREELVTAFRRPGSLRCAFEHYRAIPESDRQLREAASARRLMMPTLAVGSRPVGSLLQQQLGAITDDLRGELVADCGHIIPLDRPSALAELLVGFLG